MTDKHDQDAQNPTRTPSGIPIHYHQERKRPFQLAIGDDNTLEAVERHMSRHIGRIDWVSHELAPDLVHIDIHVVEPTHSRNYYKLVTSGMSDLPMTVPDGAEDRRCAELMLCLPPNWPLTNSGLEDSKNDWPLRLLRMLARFPHLYETWFGVGHTVPNGDPPKPLSDQTALCGVIFATPVLFKDAFAKLAVNNEKTIHILSVIPLYQSEMTFKLENGAKSLFERFAENNVTELLIHNREAVC